MAPSNAFANETQSIEDSEMQLSVREEKLQQRWRALGERLRDAHLTANVDDYLRSADAARTAAIAARALAMQQAETAMADAERRLSQRSAMRQRTAQLSRVPLEAKLDAEHELELFTGFSRALKDGGLVIATVESLEVGTPVDLHLALPDGRAVKARGEVRWLREHFDGARYGLGIAFDDIADSDLSLLEEMNGDREPTFYEA